MAYPQGDPGVAHSFGIELDGILLKSVQEISGLKTEQDVIEYKENTSDGKFIIRKLPGQRKVTDLTIKRGLTGDDSFEQWVQNSQAGKMGDARKGGAVIVYDYEGNPVKRYILKNAWVKSIDTGTLKAGDTNALMQTAVIAYDEMTIEVA